MAELQIYDNDPDRQFVERATSGDINAFEHLMQRHEQSIFRTIFRITKIHEDAEDQTQETFLRAYQNLRYFRGNSKFKTWLTQIAVNQALVCLRKRHKDVVSFIRPSPDDNEDLFAMDFADSGPNPEQRCARSELADRLEHAVNRLPYGLRSAFALRFVHEHTSLETAIKLGISIAAVKSRVSRARKRLQDHMDSP
jgi:RNA polymerase sigma-70 factor (ECF subfamily)